MNRPTSQIPAAPIGRLIQNIHRQSKKVTMKPPTGGPRIVPSMPGISSHACDATRSCLATERSITSRPIGTIIAPPTPWAKRASAIAPSDGATAQASDPVMNSRIAPRNTFCAPNRSAM